jgi:hypothetical protein
VVLLSTKLTTSDDQGGCTSGTQKFDFLQMREAITDPLVWCYSFYAFFCSVPNVSVQHTKLKYRTDLLRKHSSFLKQCAVLTLSKHSFFPILANQLNSTISPLLLSSPGLLVIGLAMFAVSHYGDKHNRRLVLGTISLTMACSC